MNPWTVLLLLAAGLSACARDNDAKDTASVPQAFHDKVETYAGLAPDFGADDCDWLLWRSLRDAALAQRGTVEQAEGEPGKWYRTPAREQGCFVDGQDAGSKSSISRDMLLGLAVYLWQAQAAGDAREVYDYAKAHDGVMGEGDPFRTDIRLGLLVTYDAIAKRAGDSTQPLPPKTESPDPSAPGAQLTGGIDDILVQRDYEAHLTVLHTLLRGVVWGGVSDLELRILKAQAERQPRNALFQAVYHKFTDGNQDAAVGILLDETLFPADHLPTGENYCTEYLFQRDEGTDNWLPCPAGKEVAHPGVDFLFAAFVVNNGLRETR